QVRAARGGARAHAGVRRHAATRPPRRDWARARADLLRGNAGRPGGPPHRAGQRGGPRRGAARSGARRGRLHPRQGARRRHQLQTRHRSQLGLGSRDRLRARGRRLRRAVRQRGPTRGHARVPGEASAGVQGTLRAVKIAPHLARTALGLAVATSSALLASCQGCEEERPYTPFTVSVPEAATTDAEAAAGPDAASSPAAEADAGSFVRQKSVKAPPGARSWQLEGRDLQAPDGRVFERALLADFDADGEPEAVAWLAPADDRARTSPGELWLYRTSGNPPGMAREKPRHLATLPGFVPTGPTCRLSPELTRTGRKTVTLDVRSTCEADLVERSPVRALLVVAPLAEQPIVLGLRVAEPAPGERLSLDVDTSDRDDDQRDDVRLRISLQAVGSERPATADVVWFDRAAGIARDPEQPGRSLAKQASLEAVRSTGKKTSQSVPDAVSNLRRLLGTLCAEGGVPRIFDADGTPLRCGDLQITVNRLALAEVQAHVTARRPLDAVSAAIRADWYLQANNEPEKLRAALAPVLDQSPAD